MADQKQPQVFVYGTLKPGGYYWDRFCEDRVSVVVRARVKGRLFVLGMGYPALVLGDGWAWGYVLTLQDSAVLVGFDMLEDYDPTRPPSENEYQRVEVDVFLEDGTPRGKVWTYVMDMEKVTHYGGVLVRDGDWATDSPERLPPLN